MTVSDAAEHAESFAEWLLTTDPETMPACWRWPLPSISQIVDLSQWPPTGEDVWGPVPPGYRGRLGWEALVRWHKGRCAACGVRPPQLVIDHDHDTGLMRGFLCGSCNTLEGTRPRAVHLHYRWCTPADLLDVRLHYTRRFNRYPQWVAA